MHLLVKADYKYLKDNADSKGQAEGPEWGPEEWGAAARRIGGGGGGEFQCLIAVKLG